MRKRRAPAYSTDRDNRLFYLVPPDFQITKILPQRSELKHEYARKTVLPRNGLEDQDEQNKTHWKSILVKWAKKYCESTTLHGFKYMAEPENGIMQRILWFFIVTALFIGAALLVIEQVIIFLQSPTLITFAQKQTVINTLPFPAITICPESQLKRSHYNFSWGMANRKNFSKEEDDLFHLIVDWCGIFKKPLPGEKHFYKSEDFYNLSNAINSYESCLNFMPFMTWTGFNRVVACNVAQPIVTELGACFAFNMLPLDQILRHPNSTLIQESWATKYLSREQIWSPDTGFMSTEDGVPLEDRTPPWSPKDGGIFNAIHLVMKTSRTVFNPACSLGGLGFVGYVHNPAEFPLGGQSVFNTGEGKMLMIQVQPKIYTLSPRLKAWPPEKRGCFLQHERTLSFFKVYTQKNCEAECAANFSIFECGCAAFYHPRLLDTPVCGPEKYWCYTFVDETVQDFSCDCLPVCSDLEYIVTTDIKVDQDWPTYLVDYDEYSPKDFSYSMIILQFHGRFIQAITRDAMFGPIDIIANAGGLLALFLGFSLLSLVEFIYFVTYKLWCMFKET